MSRRDRDWSVYAVLLRGATTAIHVPVRAVEGVLAPGRAAELLIDRRWRRGWIVEPWTSHYGSVLHVELED